MKHILLLLLGAAALTACAIVDHLDEDGIEGYLSFGFEQAAFSPCGIHEQWWVEAAPSVQVLEAYGDIVGDSAEYVPVYARLVGSRSGRGSYGHLGMYDRVFTVSRIVEMRLPDKNDCDWPGDG